MEFCFFGLLAFGSGSTSDSHLGISTMIDDGLEETTLIKHCHTEQKYGEERQLYTD
jgi:hypothetical protein